MSWTCPDCGDLVRLGTHDACTTLTQQIAEQVEAAGLGPTSLGFDPRPARSDIGMAIQMIRDGFPEMACQALDSALAELPEEPTESIEERLAAGLKARGVIPGRNPDGVNDDPEKAFLFIDDLREVLLAVLTELAEDSGGLTTPTYMAACKAVAPDVPGASS